MTEDAIEIAESAESVEETGPLRRCIVTGDRLARETMLRFVVGPDGDVVPDRSAGRFDRHGRVW